MEADDHTADPVREQRAECRCAAHCLLLMRSRTADSGMVPPTLRVALCPSVRLETPLRTYTDACSMMTLAPVMFTISINHHRLVLSTWRTLLSLRINREIYPASAPPVTPARAAISPICIWSHLI